MDHLSGLDAAFLYLETPQTPMHVGSLHVYELPAGYKGSFVDDVRKHIARRLHLAPVFRRKLLAMPLDLANPVWVLDDPDLDYHIRSAALPKPGNREQLDQLVGKLHSKLIDRSRPLWEFYVIEGLRKPADAPAGTRHVGFYAKVHHASLDGASAVVLANAMLDLTPVPREVREAPEDDAPAADAYGAAELAGAGLRHLGGQILGIGRALPTIARTAAQLLQPPPGSRRGAPRLPLPAQWFGPRTALNANITPQRAFASVSIPLDEAKRVAKAHGASLNEVVLAICSGALRRHLGAANDLPAKPLLAAVPVSLREAGNTQMNTQASMMRISLASDVADPLARLRAIHAASASAKALTSSVKAVLPTDFPSLGAPWLISGLATLYGRSRLAERMPPIANVTISNVPGSPVPLYLAGAKMLTYYPASIAIHGVALNITVQSYNGSLDFGLTACRKAMPDLADLARDMASAHRELLATVKAGAAEPESPASAKRPARRPASKATAGAAASKTAAAKKRPAAGKPTAGAAAKSTTVKPKPKANPKPKAAAKRRVPKRAAAARAAAG
jgi:WS/DGAT/MGAT family acyltransferase